MKSFRLALIVTGAALMLVPAGASAATIGVNLTNNDEFGGGPSCSLRDAVQTANTEANFGGCAAQGMFTSDPDEIEVPPGLYPLTINGGELDVGLDNSQRDIDVLGEVIIKNTGSAPAIVNGGDLTRVFDLQALGDGTTIRGLTIEHGKESFAAGIRNGGTTLIENTTISNNEATAGLAGGLYAAGASNNLTMRNVTISGNKATGDGGGMGANAGTTELTAVTISNNTADSDADGSGDGGGLSVGATTTIRGTLIGGNADDSPATKAPDCNVPTAMLTSGGNNLIGDTTSCNYAAGTGDIVDKDPKLDPLADNGGSSFTHALQIGSPAVNKGSSLAPPADQRGVLRQNQADIGAYELLACGGLAATVLGTAGKDTLVGTPQADAIVAFGGNDVIRGRGGGDKVCAGAGKDKARGGGGKDLLRGEAGKDTLLGQAGRDRLIGGPGADILRGGPGRDVLRGGPGRDKQKQ